ncbi:MAG: aquaporin [Rhizomicrobium sp.]
MTSDLARRLAAEALGTLLLVAGVVGSGIMAQNLTHDAALALLCNTLATGTLLTVLILVFAPVSGAHFNPAVTLALFARGEIAAAPASLYALAQSLGGVLGTVLAHAMFALPLLAAGVTARTGWGPMARRRRRHVRPGAHDLRDARQSRPRCRLRRPLHRRRLLVHRIDRFRQPGGDAGARPDPDLRRHPPGGYSHFPGRTIERGAARGLFRPLAVRDARHAAKAVPFAVKLG